MDTTNWKLKLTLLLVSSLTIMSVITIAPALPEMTIEFREAEHADLLVRLSFTIPALMIAMMAPLTGRLIDRHGRLKMLWVALFFYAVSGACGYFLDNLYAILLSRAVLGICVGVSMTIVITLIADYFEGTERQKFVGLQIAFMSLGGIVFIGLGGLLGDIGWRYPFLIYLFSLVILPFSIVFLREPAVEVKKTFDSRSVKSPTIIWILFINTMLMWIIFFLIPVQIPFQLKAMGIDFPSLAGAAIAISTAASALSSFSYSRIRTRLSFLSVFAAGYMLMAAGYVCISLSETYLLIIVAMILSGLGMGMMIPNTNMWVMKIAPPAIRGGEIGKLTTFWFLGQFLSPVITLPLLNVLTLSAIFMLAAVLLLLLSACCLIFHFSKSGKLVMQ